MHMLVVPSDRYICLCVIQKSQVPRSWQGVTAEANSAHFDTRGTYTQSANWPLFEFGLLVFLFSDLCQFASQRRQGGGKMEKNTEHESQSFASPDSEKGETLQETV